MRTVREILGEAKAKGAPSDYDVAAIARMTARNDHGGALLAVANLIGAKKIAARIELVNQLHDLEGELPEELYKYRYALQKELKAVAQKELDAERFEELWGAL